MSKKSIVSFIDQLAKNTQLGYAQTIKKFEQFHGTSMEDLIDEALSEQSERIPPHQLSIIDRIEDFQEYLISQEYIANTIVNHITRIKTIYKRNRVVLPYLEPLNQKQLRRREYIEYKDVLTKDEIRCALKHMRLPAQARVLAMAQGGLSNEECEHLTTRAFIDELHQYHQCNDDVDALKWLSNENNPIIWVTKLIRVKTHKPYYVILGSEAINKIAEAKLYELQLPRNKGELPAKLLNTNKQGFGRLCRDINRKCGFGLVAEESKFRPHQLRRFHATNIGGSALSYEEHSLITNSEIDEMQGRGKTATQDTYIKSNPIRQKLLYAKVMNNVSFYHEYDYTIIGDNVIVEVVDQLKKNRKLQGEVDNLTKIIQKKKKASQKVDALREELGDDTFKELLAEILNGS